MAGGCRTPTVDGDGDGLSVTAGQRRRTAGESCGFEVVGVWRGGSETTTAEDAGFGGGEAAANGNAEPGGEAMAAIVAGKKCDMLFEMGVEEAKRQFGLPARLRRKIAVFALKVVKTARKSRNSNERQERMHCFLKGRTLPPGVKHPNGNGRQERRELPRVSQLGVFHLPSRTVPRLK